MISCSFARRLLLDSVRACENSCHITVPAYANTGYGKPPDGIFSQTAKEQAQREGDRQG